ncbi:MAG: arylsulfatase [Planctomycetes bacterium]|nr:arylsulfatase [Planctomycetota bacterium]
MRFTVAYLAAFFCAGLAQAAAVRPNIVLIMVDDMGYSDIGCYGGEVQTPNIDALAAGGVRFTQFYNTGRCCPTRASLMTGLYPHQAGMGWMTTDLGHDGYRGDLNRNCLTIAEVLRLAGYSTYMAGKWHVTKHTGADGPKHNWPRQRGFDRYFGTIQGAGSFYTPKSLTRENTRLNEYPANFFYSDAINDTTVKYIEEHSEKSAGKPFFCYVAHTAPHWPLHALEEDIDKYRKRYLGGWDALRAERYVRMMSMGLVDKRWKLTDRDPAAKAWKDVSTDRKAKMALRMAIYAAQIDRVDQGIGRITAALKRTGQLENTIIFFLADNGGCAEGGIWGFERKKNAVLGKDSSFASYGLSWANASNTPFREYKHWVHEGGISTPLVVHWPAGISSGGGLRSQPGHLIDIMATCVAVSGAKYPAEYESNKIKPLEGVSLVPAFAGKALGERSIFWEHEANRAVREGDWKLVAKGRNSPWELYNIAEDRTELRDLSAGRPELTTRLAALWQAYAERANVLPIYPRGAGKVKSFSKKLVFELKAGATLEGSASPDVKGKRLQVNASLAAGHTDGVILGHGGTADGYALFIKDGCLALAVRRGGKLQTVTAVGKLSEGEVAVEAVLAKNGKVTLRAGGEVIAEGKVSGSMQRVPIEGLHVGNDGDAAVGAYEAPGKFGGRIDKLTLRLGKVR